MPKNGVAEMAVDDLLQRPADLADVQRAVPLGDRLEVRRDQPLDVVGDPVGQLRRVLGDEAGTAVERTPDPERHRQRIAALDRPVARAEQPEPRPRPGREHEVARQRRAVPLEQAHRLPLGHPRAAAR